MKITSKFKDMRKVFPFKIFLGFKKSRDLICIFWTYKIDKN